MAQDKPIVGIVMGSASDREAMQGCFDVLGELGIPFEARVISAHRTPDAAHAFAAGAPEAGLRVLIAAAGMSAALPGVLAAQTPLPVIGVPMASGPLAGADAALSIMQMPPGVPVGCMAIGKAGAKNAALYAAAVLALGDDDLAKRLADYRAAQAKKVVASDAELRRETGQ